MGTNYCTISRKTSHAIEGSYIQLHANFRFFLFEYFLSFAFSNGYKFWFRIRAIWKNIFLSITWSGIQLATASCAETKLYWSVNWSFLGDLWRRSCIRGALLAVLFGSAWTSLGSRKENEKRRLTPQEWNSLQSDCVTLRPYFCTKLRFEIWHLFLFTAYGAYRHRTYNLFAMN